MDGEDMLEDVDTAKTLWGVFISGVMLLLGISAKRTLGKIDTVEKGNGENALNLEKFKTHVSENYARETTMQTSLARIHDRMDQLVEKATVEKLGDEIGELRGDIKTLIGMAATNGRAKTAN